MINGVPLIANLIVGNEVPVILRKVLKSIRPYVDDIIVGYNGNDGNVEDVLKEFNCNYFKQVWENDFAKARNEVLDKTPSHTLVLWLDSDDEIINGDKIQDTCETVFCHPETDGVACEWEYAFDKNGNCTASLWRERIVKRDSHRWSSNKLHETLDSINEKEEGLMISCEGFKIKHLATAEKMMKAAKRNVDIIQKQYEEEVKSGNLTPKTVYDCARSHQGANHLERAIKLFKDYIDINGISDEEKCITYTILGDIYRFQKNYTESKRCAIMVIMFGSNIPDGYIDLGFNLFLEQKYHPAMCLLEMSYKFKPCKSFPINPVKYTLQPMKLLAVCYLYNGRYEEAKACAEYVLTKMHDEPIMLNVVSTCIEAIEKNKNFEEGNK